MATIFSCFCKPRKAKAWISECSWGTTQLWVEIAKTFALGTVGKFGMYLSDKHSFFCLTLVSLAALSDGLQRTYRSPSLEAEDTESEGGLCSRNTMKQSCSKIDGCFLLNSQYSQLIKQRILWELRTGWCYSMDVVCSEPDRSLQSPAS